MNEDQLKSLVNQLRETSSVEYKAPGTWEKLQPQIIREALGFANQRDGGVIIIGVEELEGKRFKATGLSHDEATSFSRNIDQSISKHGDPFVRCSVQFFEVIGNTFIAVIIDAFDGTITKCNKSCRPSDNGPEKDRIYVRSNRQPETSVADWKDLNQLVALATEIQLQILIRTQFDPLKVAIDSLKEEITLMTTTVKHLNAVDAELVADMSATNTQAEDDRRFSKEEREFYGTPE